MVGLVETMLKLDMQNRMLTPACKMRTASSNQSAVCPAPAGAA